MMENKCKRFLSLLLAFVMVLGMFPAGYAHVHAAEAGLTPVAPEAGKTYIICFKADNGDYYAMTSNHTAMNNKGVQLIEKFEGTAEKDLIWTLVPKDNGYLMQADNGQYLSLNGTIDNDAFLRDEDQAEIMTFEESGDGYLIKNPYGRYVCALGGVTGGWAWGAFGNYSTGTTVYFFALPEVSVNLTVGETYKVSGVANDLNVTDNEVIDVKSDFVQGTVKNHKLATTIEEGAYVILNTRSGKWLMNSSVEGATKLQYAAGHPDLGNNAYLWNVTEASGENMYYLSDANGNNLNLPGHEQAELVNDENATVRITTSPLYAYAWEIFDTNTYMNDLGSNVGSYTGANDSGSQWVFYKVSDVPACTYAGVEPIEDIEDGGQYLLFNTRARKVMTTESYNGGLKLDGGYASAAASKLWTITAAEGENTYYIQDVHGRYFQHANGSAGIYNDPKTVQLLKNQLYWPETATDFGPRSWNIKNGSANLNHYGGSGSIKAAGDNGNVDDTGSQWQIYKVNAIPVGTYDVTVTAKAVGETTIWIGGTVYTFHVSANHVHNFVGNVTTPANCVDKGVKTFTCECGEGTYTEVIPVDSKNHKTTEIRPEVKPTLTKEGKTEEVYCTACNTSVSGGETIPQLTMKNAKILDGGEVLALSDCEYVLGGTEGAYSLCHGGTYYVNIRANGVNCNQTTTASAYLNLDWDDSDGDAVSIWQNTDRLGYLYIHYADAVPKWNANGSYAANNCDMYLLYADANSTNADIPGYTIAGAEYVAEHIEEGESYLIAAKNTHGNWFVMVPSVTGNAVGDYIAQVVTDAVTHTHDYTVETVTKAPTCAETGLKDLKCSCGHFHAAEHKNVEIPAAHGTITHVAAKDATCTEAGNIEHWYCADCDQYWLNAECTLNTNENAVVLPALGHTYEREGGDANAVKCGDCGTANPNYQPVEVAPEVNFGGETESEDVPEEVKDEIIEDVLTNEAVNDYKPVEEHDDVEELEITFTSATVKNETPTALVFTVTPKMNGQKVSNPSEPITFRLPVPNSVAQAFAKVFHDGVEMDGLFEVKVENGDKYVEITSDSFSEYKVEFTAERSPIKVSNKAELNAALAAAQEGDTIVLTADIDYGTDHLKIDKAITLDLGGKTLTTRARNYGLALYNGCTVTNGKLNHAGTVAAIKVWDAKMISNLEIDVTGTSSSGNTIDGIVIQENATGVDTIKNVTIHSTAGQGVDTGIKTYNCGNATEPVIGSMDYVTVDAKTTGLNISALCGTATNCSISGGVNGIELWIKGTYSASLTLVDSKVEGGVYAHDEFSSNPGVTNNGTLTLTVDENTTGASAEDVILTLNRIEEEQVKGEVLENIIETAQAKVNGTYYATVAEAIKAAKAGDTVYVLEGTYNMPSMKAGITIEGVGNVLFNGTLTGTLENLTLKNIHIKGANAQRWAYAKGNLVFENVTFEATSIYALHFDGIAAGTNLTYKNCTIIGWAAMGGSPASCVFDGCTIKGNGTYGVIRTYFPATIENCTFDVSAVNPNDAYQDGIHAVDATVTVNDCKNVNGDMKDIVYTTTDKKAAYVVLDGVEIHTHKWLEVESVEPDFGVEGYKLFKCLCGAEEKRDVVAAKVAVAVIGEQKFETLAAAIAAAKAGDTITFVADITENVTINKSVTIDGADKTYTGTMTGNKGLTITIENVNFVNGGFSKSTKSNNGTYTIKNCTFDGQGTYAYPVCIKGASKLVVEDCVVSNYLYSFLYVTSGTNTVSVKNVTVENCPSYAVFFSSGVNNATFENLTVKNSNNGFLINNTANRSFTIKDCKMENVGTAIAHSKGTLAITCTAQGNNDFGTAVLSEYAKVVLTENATLTAPEGLNVTTNAGDGYKVIYEQGVYKVVYAPAAMIGTKGYATLGEAFADAQDGDTIVVMKDIDLAKETPVLLDGSYNTYFKVEGKNVTIDMNGMTISGAYTDSGKMLVGVFSTDNGGHLTVTGNGTVNVTATAKVYSLFANYEPGCSITIENGTYTLDVAHDSLLYSGCNTAENEGITVNGGTFILGNVGTGTNGKPWIINCLGGNDNATVVNGGTFNSDISHQFWANEVSIPADLALKNNGDGTWTLGEAVACAEEKATSTGATVRKVGYATLQEAIDAAGNGMTVTLLKDIELAKETTVLLDGSYNTYFKVEGKSVIIDLNGKTISGEYADTSKMLVGVFSTDNGGHLTVTGNGTVNVTSAEDATVYSLFANYEDGCSIVVKDGTYTLDKAHDSLLYSGSGNGENEGITVIDGTFTLGNVGSGTNGKPWIANVYGQNAGYVVFNGGTYNYDFVHQFWANEVFVPETRALKANGNGTWTIVDAEVYIVKRGTSTGSYDRKVGYPTFKDAVASIAKGAAETTIVLQKDITVKGQFIGYSYAQKVVIDLNGYTMSSTDKALTVYRAGTEVTVKNGTVYGNTTGGTIQATYGGKLTLGENVTIKSGGSATALKVDANSTLIVDQDTSYVLGGKNDLVVAEGATVQISAGYFKKPVQQAWCAEGYVPTDKLENGYYSVMEDPSIGMEAKIGDTYFESLQAAIEAAQDGDVIVVVNNITVDTTAAVMNSGEYAAIYNVAEKAITIDLNGKKIEVTANAADLESYKSGILLGVFCVDNNGELTLTGNGTVTANAVDASLTSDDSHLYSLMVAYGAGSKLTVENGTFHANSVSSALVYSQYDEIVTINGGTYTLGNLGTDSNGSPWLFNAKGQNERNILVNGGTFSADIQHQYYPFEVQMVKELALSKGEDGMYTVVPAVAYVNEQEWSSAWYTNYVGYATVEEAMAASEGVKTVVSGKKTYTSEQENVYVLASELGDVVIPAEFTGSLVLDNCTVKSITNNSATAKIVVNGNVVVENDNGSAITGEIVNISGTGTLTAIANGEHAYGIGGDATKSITIENVRILDVKGGYVQPDFVYDTKYGKSEPEGGAAIGSGFDGAVITLTNVTIDNAQGGSKAAGIGARYHTGVVINITDCTIKNVEGGNASAGIGGSRVSSGRGESGTTINILNSTITAKGGQAGAGIGSGYDTHCQAGQPICTINIDGSTINAVGGKYAAGVGTGYHNAGLAGEIKNSTVNAASGEKFYKDTYTQAMDIGFGVVDPAREARENNSSITFNGKVIAIPAM